MPSVNRVIVLNGSVSAGASQETVEAFSPASGETIEAVGLATNANTNIGYFLKLNETTLIDGIEGDDAPDLSDPFRFEVGLAEGDDITVLADNDDTSSAHDARVYLLVEDTAQPGL